MEIVVQVGTPEQQEQIKTELCLFEGVTGAVDPPLRITQVIVADDFDRVVNGLQGTTSYRSAREQQQAIGKIVEVEGGFAIVLSPLLYTEEWDGQMRVCTFVHEVVHLTNKRRIPRPQTGSAATLTYFESLYNLFDEYDANRTAFRIVDRLFPSKTDRFEASRDENFEGHLRALVDDRDAYNRIKEKIASFRQWQMDVDQFLESISELVECMLKDVVYAYSYIDHYPRLAQREADLLKSEFVNDRTMAVIDFFRAAYDSGAPDLMSGVPLFAEFLANFGLRFEDMPTGELYCHVLDI